MRHVFIYTAMAGLLLGMTASAQDRDRDRDDRSRDRDDQRYQDQRHDESYWRGHLFERVREDLERIQSEKSRFNPEQYDLARTKRELNELQSKLESRGYDQPELDRVINGLERIVNDSNLSSRDRDMLNDDLRRMRQFREHRGRD
jgi:hypothetical protein